MALNQISHNSIRMSQNSQTILELTKKSDVYPRETSSKILTPKKWIPCEILINLLF